MLASAQIQHSNAFKNDQQLQNLAQQFRTLAKHFFDFQDYQSAAFYAEKVLYITNEPSDVYERAKCLFNLGEYHRAAYSIKSRKFHETDLACLHLAANCYFMEKRYKDALQLLDSPLVTQASVSNCANSSTATLHESETTVISRQSKRMSQRNSHLQSSATTSNRISNSNQSIRSLKKETHRSSIQSPSFLASSSASAYYSNDKNISRLLGCIYQLKGRIYELLDNRKMAENSFMDALDHDVYCYSALTSLTKHHMLTIDEERNFFKDLNLDSSFQDNKNMGSFIKLFYEFQMKKYHKPQQITLPPQLEFLSNNVDYLTALAERHYFNCDYYSAFEVASNVLEKDAHHMNCLPTYILSLIEIEKPIQLFDIAHQLVDLFPESAISWFAVGCYYLVIEKVEQSRRYLSKATTLDNVFGPAWLAYGHSFAIEKEHDQAMAAYFRAYHLMPGNHLPLLFIGVEYGRADDFKLAEKFLTQAKAVAPDDPYVLHEFAIMHYRNRDYNSALIHFTEAESILRDFNPSLRNSWLGTDKFKQKWEPLINNIGHTLRQLGRYDEAIEYHNKAATLFRAKASTYTALGLLYYLKEDWDKALENLNNALSIRHHDSISTSLLEKTIPKYAEALKMELTSSNSDKSKSD